MAVPSGPVNDAATAVAGLRTKVRRPREPRDLVERPRLLDLLDRSLACRLILVSAPAGFGKTTLLSSWATRHDRVAWLSLDEGDDDLATFVRALIGAVRAAAPEVGRATLGLLHLPELPPPAYLAARLSDELAELPGDLVLVVDDYHTLRERSVHGLVTTLLFRLPENVHLLIASREDPPLPIATLRARGELAEVRMAELGFTADEARAFLEKALGALPSESAVADLAERTEGWAAGLRLAALAMAGQVDGSGSPPALAAPGVPYSFEFLIDDVFGVQPPDVRDVLLRLAVPDRLCGPLLDALLDRPEHGPSGEERLRALANANLFLVPLDDEGTWYRYHHLFRDALRRRLREQRGETAAALLHERASVWFAGQGLIEEAIRHALAAGNRERAVALVEENVHPMLDREEGPGRLEEWLRLLPAELVDARPALLIARSWALLLRHRFTEIPMVLRAAEARLGGERSGAEDSGEEALRGQLDAIWSLVWQVQGDAQRTLEAADRALERLPAGWLFARGRTEFYRAAALQRLGRAEEAVAWLSAACAESSEAEAPRLVALLRALARLHLVSLDPERAERAARQLVALGESRHLVLSAAWGHVLVALVAYEWNELATAREHFQAALAGRDRLPMLAVLDGVLGLALTHQALGETRAARSVLGGMAGFVREVGGEGSLVLVDSVEVRLALAAGDVEVAWSLTRRMGDRSLRISFVEEPWATRARWLLARGNAGSLDEASRLVDDLERAADAQHHPLRRVRTDALRALVFQARGDTEAALDILRRTIDRSRPAGLVRTFVDLGPSMQRLLVEQARRTTPADPYLDQLLDAFPATTGPLDAAAPSRRATPGALIEPLTWRELEILRLLDARLTNKEIARTLQISWQTVSKHTANIYQKLQAGSRRDAVARAHALGVLRAGERRASEGAG